VGLGKVRFIGVSNFVVSDLEKAQASLSKYKIASNQVRYNPTAQVLTGAARHAMLAELHSPRFVDLPPAEVYATLLDDGRYL